MLGGWLHSVRSPSSAQPRAQGVRAGRTQPPPSIDPSPLPPPDTSTSMHQSRTAAAAAMVAAPLYRPLLLLLLLACCVSAAAAHLRLRPASSIEPAAPTPVVIMHGMGDSGAAQGIQHLAEAVGAAAGGAHVLAVQFGWTQLRDQLDSFLVPMNEQVEAFAAALLADPMIASSPTVDAIGISQGNLVIRGYIQRYAHNNTYPRLRRWISIHGPLLGVAGLPGCNRTRVGLCNEADSLVDIAAYSALLQAHLAQADYYRDPLHIPAYLRHNTFLPYLNHEANNQTNRLYPYGLDSLEALVLVKALQDREVWPRESEWFGFYPDGSVDTVVSMRETELYQTNAFGLRTLDEAGRVIFDTTPGDHCEFELDWLQSLVRRYFVAESNAVALEA